MADQALIVARRIAARAAILTAASLLVFVASASAKTHTKTHTFTVKSTKDAVHGSCGKTCTLRDAVIAADKAGGKSTIIIPKGTYKLTIKATSAGTPTDNPEVGDLDIDNEANVTIRGAGSAKTILNAAEIDRLFAVHPLASLTLSGVTAENGNQGGGGASEYSINPASGGAFYNAGALTIEKCVLKNNSAEGIGGVVFAVPPATSTSITGSKVTGSKTAGPGAVIYAVSGSLTLSDDTADQNLSSSIGGVVFAATGKSVTVSHTTMDYNRAEEGGALYLTSVGDVSVTRSEFSQNNAGSQGGAIEVDEATSMTVSDSSFSDNTSIQGGAIANDDASLFVKASHFTDNVGSNSGAVYLDAPSTKQQSITDSVFTGNRSVEGDGGGISVNSGNLAVNSSTFYRDLAGLNGGALYYGSGAGMSLVNDTFDSNTAGSGGGLYLTDGASAGSIVVRNDTIARNVAITGGGITDPYYANVIENTIVADNAGNSGAGAATGDGDCDFAFDYANGGMFTGTADDGHNLDSDHSCIAHPGGSPAAGDKTANPKLGPLRNNGGPVPTDALLKGSPAIGAADKAQCPKTDARGVKRTGKCSIGAYQAAPKTKKKKTKKKK